MLPTAQAELRTARQPGAALALASVPALPARSRCAAARVAGAGPSRTRGDGACPAAAGTDGSGCDPDGAAAEARDAGGGHVMFLPPASFVMTTASLRIGTRGSPLALWQAN